MYIGINIGDHSVIHTQISRNGRGESREDFWFDCYRKLLHPNGLVGIRHDIVIESARVMV